MIVVKHVDSIFGSLLPIRLSTFKLVLIRNWKDLASYCCFNVEDVVAALNRQFTMWHDLEYAV